MDAMAVARKSETPLATKNNGRKVTADWMVIDRRAVIAANNDNIRLFAG
jgi:hypothetical protein